MFFTFNDKLTAEQENYSATMEIHFYFKILMAWGRGPPHHGEVLRVRGQAPLRVLELWLILIFRNEGVDTG